MNRSLLLVALGAIAVGLLHEVYAWRKHIHAEFTRRADIIASLKAAQDHDPCLEIIGSQWDELDRIQHERAIERGQAMVAEVEQWLEGQES